MRAAPSAEHAARAITRPGGHGIAIAGTLNGPDDGIPLLLLHGGGQTRHAWARTGAALGRAGYRATAYDLRGHGDSAWAERYDVTDFAADVTALAAAERTLPILVGASMGGLASLIANSGEHEISRALILVDIAPRVNPAGVEKVMSFMAAQPEGFASLEEAAAAVAAYQPQRAQRSDVEGLKKNLRQRDGRWYWHWDPALLAHFNQARQQTMDEDLFYRAAEKLRQPVLLVRGTLSSVIDADITREFQQRIPHSRVVDVSGAGHMVAGDRNDLFLDAIMEFLAKL